VCKIAYLNKSQIDAVKACRNLLDLLDLFLVVWGPSGTGKTYTAAACICFLLQCNINIVDLAPSNSAANQLLTSIINLQAKFEQGGRTINGYERPS
jgi:superfamily II DNA or RNA helicase